MTQKTISQQTKKILTIIVIAFLATPTLTAQDTLPAPRCEFASAYLDGSWYIFGGLVDSAQSKYIKTDDIPDNDMWEFTEGNDGWLEVADYNPPPVRNNHKMVEINGKLYTFGGEGTDPDNFLRDTWVYDPATKTWTDLTQSAMGDIPNNVANYGLTVNNNQMYLYGGHSRYNSGGQTDEVTNYLYSYNTVSNYWQYISTSNQGPKRKGASVETNNGKMFVWGGRDENNTLTNSIWEYDFNTTTWTDITPASGALPLPFDDAGSTVATVNQEYGMMMFGGVDNPSNTTFGLKLWFLKFNTTPNTVVKLSTNWESSSDGLKMQGFALASGYKASGDTCTLTVFGGRDTLWSLNNRFARYVFDTTFCDVYEYDTLNSQWVPQGTVGILESQIIPKVKVYPNPANDIINIEFDSKQSKRFTISLFNINGQLVERKLQKGTTVKTWFATKHLNNGVYMITISSGNKLLFRNKVMKQ